MKGENNVITTMSVSTIIGNFWSMVFLLIG
jgi:hypothetical protein